MPGSFLQGEDLDNVQKGEPFEAKLLKKIDVTDVIADLETQEEKVLFKSSKIKQLLTPGIYTR